MITSRCIFDLEMYHIAFVAGVLLTALPQVPLLDLRRKRGNGKGKEGKGMRAREGRAWG